MSVPVLLTVLETNASAATQATTLLDDHITSCTSYVDAAALLVTSGFVTPTIDELEVSLDVTKPASTCKPTLQNFTVQLVTELEPHERVGLTGDLKSLGEWQLERCVPLMRQNNLEWGANVMLLACRDISYRYFIYTEDKKGHKQIRRWETELKPRTLKPGAGNMPKIDRFGMDENGSAIQVNRGWLTNEKIIQLQFVHKKMFQVRDIEKFDTDDILIKVLPLKEGLDNVVADAEGTDTEISVEAVKFEYGSSVLQPQQSYGIDYKRGDTVIFHITVPDAGTTPAFALVFHNSAQQPIGSALIKPTDLKDSEGVLKLEVVEPMPDSEISIATLTLPYLIVRPFEGAKLDFRTTFAHYWPKSWPSLDVGHRGNGKSYIAEAPAEPENTIASFMRAYDSLADMVELDVHLTADGVPIIYHDFGLYTAPKGKNINNPNQLEYVLIKDVSYEALKRLRVFAVINDKVVEYPAHNAEQRPEQRIFPRLIEILENLPKTLGIDVEIKWPQLLACGYSEAQQTIDKNFFVDRVLSTIIANGCGRPLIFSSFDADICTMLRFKQNIFPVMFLTIGETKKWEAYMDLRTRTVEAAINNAQAFELAGTAPHAEDFLTERGIELLQKVRNLGQIAVVWGDDLNSRERLQYFSEIGATAICYDRSDLYTAADKQRAFFNSTDLMAEFEKQYRF